MLTGYKTYIVAAIALLTAILSYIDGQLTLPELLQAGGLAIGLGGTRALLRSAAVLTTPYRLTAVGKLPDPRKRASVTYFGVVVAILSALLAYFTGQQDLPVTIAAVLSALGLTFLGSGLKRLADGNPVG